VNKPPFIYLGDIQAFIQIFISSLYAGVHLTGKELGRKRPGGPGRHQLEHVPAKCPCSKEC